MLCEDVIRESLTDCLTHLLVVSDQIVVRRDQHEELQQAARPALVVPDSKRLGLRLRLG